MIMEHIMVKGNSLNQIKYGIRSQKENKKMVYA